MIIRTCVPPKKVPAPVVETKSVEKDEEVIVKPVNKAVNKKKKSTPVYSVVEEKIEDEDLSQWLKEHTEE